MFEKAPVVLAEPRSEHPQSVPNAVLASQNAALFDLVESLKVQLDQARIQETKMRQTQIELMSKYVTAPPAFAKETATEILTAVKAWSDSIKRVTMQNVEALSCSEAYTSVMRERADIEQGEREAIISKLKLILSPLV